MSKYYFTGRPCKRGHLSKRLILNRNCVECMAEYRKLNSERIALLKLEWKKNNPDRVKQNDKIWSSKNQDKRKKARAKWALKNPEALVMSRRSWRARNHEASRLSSKNWEKNNPDKRMANLARRRAAAIHAIPKWLDEDDFFLITEAYSLARLRTKMFGFQWHVDHIFPLQGKTVCGLHVPKNLQVIPAAENYKKSNKVIHG